MLILVSRFGIIISVGRVQTFTRSDSANVKIRVRSLFVMQTSERSLAYVSDYQNVSHEIVRDNILLRNFVDSLYSTVSKHEKVL